jgi:hypothetical protein
MFDDYQPQATSGLNYQPNPQGAGLAPRVGLAGAPANVDNGMLAREQGVQQLGQMPALDYKSQETTSSVKFLIIGLSTLILVLVIAAVAYQMVLKPKFQNIPTVNNSEVTQNSDQSGDTSLENDFDNLTPASPENVILVDSDTPVSSTLESDLPLASSDEEVEIVQPLPKTDTDGDGVTDDIEALKGTNPANSDTDADGLSDGLELDKHLTDPLKPDTDQDGLTDSEEISVYQTDPLIADTDMDGYSDGQEVKNNYNPKGEGRLTIK